MGIRASGEIVAREQRRRDVGRIYVDVRGWNHADRDLLSGRHVPVGYGRARQTHGHPG